jgi:hypothetical protein
MTAAQNGGSAEAATQDGDVLETGARDQKLDAVAHGGLNIPGEVLDEARQQAKDEAKKAKEKAGSAKAAARLAKKVADGVAAKAAETNKPEDKEAAGEAAAKAAKLKKKAADAEAEAKEADKVAKSLPPAVIPDETAPWFGKLYYDGGGAYWLSNGIGGWVKVNEKGAERALREMGIGFQRDTDLTSPIDRALLAIQKRFKVDYAGKLAGYKAGVTYQNGDRILITSGRTLIEPKDGDFPTINALLNRMWGEKRIYFDAWLKQGAESLIDGSLRTGQVLVLAGPKDSGKSFVQNHIITPLLGGRSFNPTLYMSGGTPFTKMST